jgi:coproporphyrinogen III oxidase-like Fe-S oxidoreductase
VENEISTIEKINIIPPNKMIKRALVFGSKSGKILLGDIEKKYGVDIKSLYKNELDILRGNELIIEDKDKILYTEKGKYFADVAVRLFMTKTN